MSEWVAESLCLLWLPGSCHSLCVPLLAAIMGSIAETLDEPFFFFIRTLIFIYIYFCLYMCVCVSVSVPHLHLRMYSEMYGNAETQRQVTTTSRFTRHTQSMRWYNLNFRSDLRVRWKVCALVDAGPIAGNPKQPNATQRIHAIHPMREYIYYLAHPQLAYISLERECPKSILCPTLLCVHVLVSKCVQVCASDRKRRD